MRQKQLSCVLVVEHGQLVGVFTERDVVTKVAAAPLDVDHVPLQDVMQPDPECPQLDDALVSAFHLMHRGAYRHVPVVDEQRRPIAPVSMQVILDELVAALPQGLCRKFCSGRHEGAVALVCGGITRPGRRTVRPQCGPRLQPPRPSVVF
jgi:CBS domain-containing protein